MKIREIMETLQLNKILDKGDRKYNQLMTPWGEQIAQEQTEVVLTKYPRPQMARKNHIILNGIWKYAFTGDDERPVLWDGDIRVPFLRRHTCQVCSGSSSRMNTCGMSESL